MSDNLVSRIYSGFRGVDFRGNEVNLVRSPDSLNMWKDYKEIDSIRTRPATKLFGERFDWDAIYGVFFYNIGGVDTMLVHCGDTLYKYVDGKKTELYSGLNKAKSDSFIYNNTWYFKDGKNYLQYDGETIKEVVGYIPTTSINRKPVGGGTVHEDVNLLSTRRINTFVGDGESKEYHLDTQECNWEDSPEESVTVYVDGRKVDIGDDQEPYPYIFKPTDGVVNFTNPPPAPLTDGQANVSIEFSKETKGYAERIKECTLLQVFDNRVFFSGNKNHPNTVWHSSLNDPSYCSDLDYYNEGLDSTAVRGIVAGNNALWVFREPSESNTSVFYHTPTLDSQYGKIYPNTHSNISTGCVGKAINFNDDIVFFSDRGMEGISGDITTEQFVAHRSTLVDRKMLANASYRDMMLVEWEGYLLVIIGNEIYLADSRSVFTVDNHYEYEWFYWTIGHHNITTATVHDGILYLGTGDGEVYTLTDTKANVMSHWVTPIDKFKHPHKLKTTNKRGCVVEATGDISVYAKLEDTEFELIGKYENVTDYFVSRIKRKKFKDLQLKFSTNKRFSLETATIECFVGGYIKR